MLISIFFIVYANIQTELFREQQMMAIQLREDAIKLQKIAQEEAARAFEKVQLLEEELAECGGSE